MGAVTERRIRRRPAEAGFTLLEVLVVLAILGLIVTLVGPRVIDYFGRAKGDAARLQVESLATALDFYRLDVGGYPTQEQGLKALIARPADVAVWRGPYLKAQALPDDPWGRPYVYRRPSRHGLDYDLFSLGADATEGGEGEAADIANWRR
ncbi:MAG: type II secretion system protein GspG [Alphaproteobacteria bacterium]|nr:type II secretion system protein GspG [Alphaproteobacteria bacterium]